MVIVNFRELDHRDDDYDDQIPSMLFDSKDGATLFLTYRGYDRLTADNCNDVYMRRNHHSQLQAVIVPVEDMRSTEDDSPEEDDRQPQSYNEQKIRLVYNVQVSRNEDEIVDILTQHGGVFYEDINTVTDYEAYVDIESLDDIHIFMAILDDLDQIECSGYQISVELRRWERVEK